MADCNGYIVITDHDLYNVKLIVYLDIYKIYYVADHLVVEKM